MAAIIDSDVESVSGATAGASAGAGGEDGAKNDYSLLPRKKNIIKNGTVVYISDKSYKDYYVIDRIFTLENKNAYVIIGIDQHNYNLPGSVFVLVTPITNNSKIDIISVPLLCCNKAYIGSLNTKISSNLVNFLRIRCNIKKFFFKDGIGTIDSSKKIVKKYKNDILKPSFTYEERPEPCMDNPYAHITPGTYSISTKDTPDKKISKAAKRRLRKKKHKNKVEFNNLLPEGGVSEIMGVDFTAAQEHVDMGCIPFMSYGMHSTIPDVNDIYEHWKQCFRSGKYNIIKTEDHNVFKCDLGMFTCKQDISFPPLDYAEDKKSEDMKACKIIKYISKSAFLSKIINLEKINILIGAIMVKILTDKERIFKCPEPICRSLIVTPLRGYDHEVIKCPTCETKFCFHCNFFYRDLDASPIWLYFEENYAIENYGMVHSMEVCIREYEFSKAPDKHARDAIMKLVKGRECPVCKYVVVKQSGCDHINCTNVMHIFAGAVGM